jgi:hypothetical protein
MGTSMEIMHVLIMELDLLLTIKVVKLMGVSIPTAILDKRIKESMDLEANKDIDQIIQV